MCTQLDRPKRVGMSNSGRYLAMPTSPHQIFLFLVLSIEPFPISIKAFCIASRCAAVFSSCFDAETGPISLAGLFGDYPQLIVYHFMFHPDWNEGCKSCSFWADGYDRLIPHLNTRNVAFAAVSRAPMAKLLAYRQRMGWSFQWVSASQNSFNSDFHVSFTAEELAAGTAFYNYRTGASVGEEMPGVSVFYRATDGAIFHTYSSYARGLDTLNSAYQYLDIVPLGRDEDNLASSMQWLKRHDEYTK